MAGLHSAPLRPTDFMDFDSLLFDEERQARRAARDFVDAEVLPIIEEHAQAQRFPLHLVRMMGELGFLGPTLPERFGGAELSSVGYGLLMYELERGDSGVRSFASVQGSLVMHPIHEFGTDAQKERWLPRLARGEAIGCFGLTEPDFGSDPAGIRTRAEPLPGRRWRLDWAKMWITNGSLADVAVVWAKAPDGIRGFLVEKGTPGFSAPAMHGKWSLRASNTAELALQDVVVDEEPSLLPGAAGLRAALSCLDEARFGIAWGVLGAAEACLRCALEYAKTRVQFGRPIAGFQLQQEKLVFMTAELAKAQLLALRLGRLKEERRAAPEQISLAKMNNVQAALEIARKARTILGANGIVGEYPVMRHMTNLESVYTYEGTHDIHTLIVGRALTGLAAFT